MIQLSFAWLKFRENIIFFSWKHFVFVLEIFKPFVEFVKKTIVWQLLACYQLNTATVTDTVLSNFVHRK